MRALLLVFLMPVFAWSQRDTIQEMEEVRVSIPVRRDTAQTMNSTLDAEDIRALQAEDVGDILRKFSGTNLRSYGGLGGLKTVSVRSLGSQHTVINVDGFSMQNTQTGQINLGQLQVVNLESASDAKNGELKNLPVSALVSGSAFFVQSFENAFGKDRLSIRSNVAYGSFDHGEAYLAARYRPGKWLLSASGTYRRAKGNYPYTYFSGYTPKSDVRTNNDYFDASVSGTVGYQWKRTTVRAGYVLKEIDQGLPGAVIFYNQTQNERLFTRDEKAFGDVETSFGKWSGRFYVQGCRNTMRYTDPDYLNLGIGLEYEYFNRVLNGGISIRRALNKWTFLAGTEEFLSSLKVDNNLFAEPVRMHNLSLLSAQYSLKHLEFTAHVSSQYVAEHNLNGQSAQDRFRINPYVSVIHRTWNGRFSQEIWYRNSFRMPSFNELYYNNIGNKNLLPEDAHQISYGVSVIPVKSALEVRWRSNVFVNFVKNKIVAVPLQNLFIWSMQNVGDTRIYGLEAMLDLDWKFCKHWRMEFAANYTYQRALDYTDPQSPTYRNQIAYIPVHTGNADLTVRFRKTGLRVSNYALSRRYVLNENVVQNEVKGFWVTDAGLFHTFSIGKAHELTLRATVKNVFNRSYAYIRSYVMPGANYLISLNYALH